MTFLPVRLKYISSVVIGQFRLGRSVRHEENSSFKIVDICSNFRTLNSFIPFMSTNLS